MVIEMGRYRIRCHIVCRMLHRGKGVDVLSHGKHDDTAGMLSGTSPDAGTALGNPVDFTGSLVDASLLIVVLYITECGFVRKGRNGTGTEGLSGAENNFRVFVRLTLVFTGEV